jgi:hypothetical protein
MALLSYRPFINWSRGSWGNVGAILAWFVAVTLGLAPVAWVRAGVHLGGTPQPRAVLEIAVHVADSALAVPFRTHSFYAGDLGAIPLIRHEKCR